MSVTTEGRQRTDPILFIREIPPRGVETPYSNTANNEKSIEGGAESGADQAETDELVGLLDSMTPEQREALIALIRTER